ncbi:molybdenum cofactor biosynthesis protein MoaE [Schlesneria paludicola]|uniref:molybdenum cofactor biosynthesis protein MoaE n=1 Tax=Schlesneria paludicola TaxID=360056 RepID=UPI00029AC38F|nr:molybdenum cofactor biosynthesis protein MoaE [Schlesneria paludicola]
MSENTIQITHDPIQYSTLIEDVRSRIGGAVVLFLGTVREMTGGQKTIALDYEAYPQMAQSTLEEIVLEAYKRWPIVNTAIAHRLGRLEPGEISVAIAVCTPHRHQAFEASKYLIDRIKEVVPIWKKENSIDGSTEWIHPGIELLRDE